MAQYQIKGMGRLPAYPDIRDLSIGDAQQAVAKETKDSEVVHRVFEQTKKADIVTTADNSADLPPVRNQGNIGACVSFAWTCAMEYLHKWLYKRDISFSQLYLYKMARDLAFGYKPNGHGDTGLWLRNGCGALVRFGALDSSRYPYDTSKYDQYPPSHMHAYADDFRAMKYFRLDSPKVPKEQHLTDINKWITEKWPVTTGFFCFESLDLDTTARTGEVPFPRNGEKVIGGHAIYLYGYDLDKEITNPVNGQKTKGAWKFRNSWGTGWGLSGNGFLPFAYLTDLRYGQPLADEFYSITSSTWLNIQDFE